MSYGENIRITTDYTFEVLNVDNGGFYPIWIKGDEGALQIAWADTPDTTGVAMELPDGQIPAGTDNSNYRIDSSGSFQLYNVDNGKWYNVWVRGELGQPPQFCIHEEGEE